MRRKKLPPKPEMPPEGYMYIGPYGEIVPIKTVEREAKTSIMFCDSPNWDEDPTYNMKINKRRKQDAI